jgi:hypothetical protein
MTSIKVFDAVIQYFFPVYFPVDAANNINTLKG